MPEHLTLGPRWLAFVLIGLLLILSGLFFYCYWRRSDSRAE